MNDRGEFWITEESNQLVVKYSKDLPGGTNVNNT
jgi:hypothetical protein